MFPLALYIKMPYNMPMEPSHSIEAYADEAFRAVVAAPSQMVTFPLNSTRGDIIRQLSRGIPSNDFGLPVYYYRTDLLDMVSLQTLGRTTQDELDVAVEPLQYNDGYPTFANGAPFWAQMPHEPRPNFILFQRYLELSELEGIRLLDTLAHQEHMELATLLDYSLEYLWSARARAYDLFIVAAEAKRREALTRKTEKGHFNAAEKLLAPLVAKFEDPEFLEKLDTLDPKELVDIAETLMKIQRLSLGLTGQNASSTQKDLATPGSSVEVILKQLTKNSGSQASGGASIMDRLGALMQDEHTALNAQEIIIRATSDGNIVNSTSV